MPAPLFVRFQGTEAFVPPSFPGDTSPLAPARIAAAGAFEPGLEVPK